MTVGDAFSRRGFLVRAATAAGGVAAAGGPLAGRALGAPRRADTVITNARVWTGGPRPSWARALAIKAGRIVYVGSAHGAADFASGARVINARNRLVIPGVVDGHSHPLSGGHSLTAPSLNYEALTLQEFLDRIRAFLDAEPDAGPNDWLVVGAWDTGSFATDFPTKEDLDSLGTDRPIMVKGLDGHISLVNSRALELAGITRATPDPDEGRIERDENGEPTGVLLDAAQNLVEAVIPAPTTEEDAAALRAAYDYMLSKGVTGFLDAAVFESTLAAYAHLHADGEPGPRAAAAIWVDPEQAADPAVALEYAEDLRSTYASRGLTLNTVKLFFDGVIEYPQQTAALLEPYIEGDFGADWRGPTYFEQDVADGVITALDEAGWQVHVHAIGDRAARSALDAFAVARRANGTRGRRHTITHLELIDPADYGRFAELGVIPSFTLNWAGRDSFSLDATRPYIGDARWRRLYPARRVLRRGGRVAGGSDWPVTDLVPFSQIEMAVTRTTIGAESGKYSFPLNRTMGLSLREALIAHTYGGAFQLHRDKRVGTLAVGKDADLLLLDQDVFRVPIDEVHQTRPLVTMVRGRQLYTDRAFDG